MSEDVSTLVDETPPPDVVERPARGGGVYKLCMACGQNVLRFEYRAGSSICKRCEALAQDGVPAELEAAPAAADPVAAAAPAQDRASVGGSAWALEVLRGMCGVPGAADLTLDDVVHTLHTLQDERAQMIGRVTRYGVRSGEVRPDEVPLETAAQALWLACDPILQEALTASMELLGLSLNQVMLGNLAFSRQELLNQDQSLVPQASLAVQYGQGRGLLTQGSGRLGLPGGRLVDAQGQLVKDCLCCGREFHPPRDRPNPDFCDDYCGTFVDQLRIWATNTVLNELRYPGTTEPRPQPDPRTFWPVERCQEERLAHALAFREQRVAQQMAQAREQQQKMRGLG
jgi:hypothetical protein